MLGGLLFYICVTYISLIDLYYFVVYFSNYSYVIFIVMIFFFFKQKTAYEMRISDWSSDVCSSDLMSHPWSGVFPAVTTKMSRSGDLDLPAMRESLERLIANGVSGAIVLPMLGENASLTLAERDAVIRTAAEVVDGPIPLLSGPAETTLGPATGTPQPYRSWGAT